MFVRREEHYVKRKEHLNTCKKCKRIVTGKPTEN